MQDWVFLVQSTPEIVYDVVSLQKPMPERKKKRSRYERAVKAAVLLVQFVLWLKSI